MGPPPVVPGIVRAVDVPDVPGITRADHVAHENGAEPAQHEPLFSTEGLVRQYEMANGGRSLGTLAGFGAALLAAGSAFGHNLGPRLADAKAAVASGGFGKTRIRGGLVAVRNLGSPDLDRYGNKRAARGRRRRRAGAMLLGGALGVVLVGFTLTAAFPPVPNAVALSGSPNTSSNSLIGVATSQPSLASTVDPIASPTVDPSAVLVGDESLAPSATPPPTTKPTVAPTPRPTLARTAVPAPTPSPSAAPPAAPTVDTQEAGPLAVGTAYNFWVFYIPGSSCTLIRTLDPGGKPLPSTPFLIQGDGKSGPVPWGAPPAQGSRAKAGTYTITATCTAPGGTAKLSPPISRAWTSAASPTPANATTPPPGGPNG